MAKAADMENGKVIAIISYITIIGWIIALIMNQEKKNEFARYHMRQSLLLNLAFLVGSMLFWFPIIGQLVFVALVILWVFGLVYAIQGERKEVPLIGPLAMDWFKKL